MDKTSSIYCSHYTDEKHKLYYDEQLSEPCHSVFSCKCGYTEYEPEDAGTGA